MPKSRSLHQAVRFALATATAAAGVSALHAQEAPAPAPAAAAAPIQEVVVTGSRLQTPNETAISPISTLSSETLAATGLTRVEDVLNTMPQVFASMNSTTSNGADGTASVDLRGLGPQRTLVLVNGLRLGPGSSIGGRNFSDINQIPAALIERVDVLTGGASAVYGADAVAGVVNFILNTHFEGIKVDAGYHFNQHNNDNQAGVAQLVTAADFPLPSSNVDTGFGKNASIIMGSNFADNRGNATAYITYDNQGSTLQNKFDYSSCSLGPVSTQPPVLGCSGSGTSKGGRFYASTPGGHSFITHTVMPNGTFQPIGTPGNVDTYNYGPLNYYQTPNVRWTGGAFVNYDINSHVNAYMNVMFMRNEMDAQIAPSGDFYQPSFIPCADPLLTASAKTQICNPAFWAMQGNPTENYNGTAYNGLNMEIGRRNVEGGDRIAHFNNDMMREVVGLKGDFAAFDPQNAFTWNVYAQHGQVDNSDSNLNYLGNTQIQQSLNALPGPGGKTVCGGPTAPFGPLVPTSIYYPFLPTQTVSYGANSACVPWNIWAPGAVTPAQLAYLSIPAQEQGTTEEYVVDGSVTGDLGKLGAKLPWSDSGLQANVGVEWRSESTNFQPDYEEETANLGGGGGSVVPIYGSFHVKEVFTELRLPIASHQFLAEDLSVEGGYRYSDYNAGSGFTTNTYKFGLDWAPVRDIRLRGSYQRAVRAPNIGELYTPQAVLLDGSTDPCTGAVPVASLAGCELSGVKPAQYGHIPGNPAAQYNGLLGGSPTLEPESADTYTVGFVIQPRWVQNLSVSVDYFHIKIDNVIGPIGGNTILLDCVSAVGNAAQAAQFCPLVHRDPSGSLWRTTEGYVIDLTKNEGELLTEGIDLNVSYRHTLGRFGSWALSIQGTYTQDLTTEPIPGYGSYNCVGYFGDTCGGGNPKWRQVTNWTWSTPWSGLDLNLRLRYFGADKSEQLSSNPFLAGTPYLPLSAIPAYTYIDLSGSFNLYKNVTLQLGINNITDKVPPLVTAGDCSTSTPNASGANCNGNTFPGFYDAMGRYLFAHVTAQF